MGPVGPWARGWARRFDSVLYWGPWTFHFYQTFFFLIQITSRNVIREKNKITLDNIYTLQKGRAYGPQYNSLQIRRAQSRAHGPHDGPSITRFFSWT